jgi:hypothetical protein
VLRGLFVGLFCCSTQNRWVFDPIAFAWEGFGAGGLEMVGLGLGFVGDVIGIMGT